MQRETVYDMVYDAQEHYRLLLDAMARPGSIRNLPHMPLVVPTPLNPAAALIGFALLNADVTFHINGPDAVMAGRYLLVNTASHPAEPESADFVFASGAASAGLPEMMKKGTLAYPEEGATLILNVEALDTEMGELALKLRGPGVAGERTFFARGLDPALVEALQHCNKEFPLGIDLILADTAGCLVCIPRSSRVRWEQL